MFSVSCYQSADGLWTAFKGSESSKKPWHVIIVWKQSSGNEKHDSIFRNTVVFIDSQNEVTNYK